jgi:hypothetical protein
MGNVLPRKRFRHLAAAGLKAAAKALSLAVLLFTPALPAQTGQSRIQVITPLTLTTTDIRIENSNDGGYVLWVRAKPEIKSILITESTEPGDHKVATYAMRSTVPHPFNGDQKRILDGKVIDGAGLNFLVSSTSLPDRQFGQAYRLFLPYVIEYGYPSGRHGQIQLYNETFLSIRTFAKPWADYSGAYLDNPYKLILNQLPPPVVSSVFNKQAFIVFEHLANGSGVKLRSASGGKGLADNISEVLKDIREPDVDLALCLDATASMQPYADFVRKDLAPLLKDFVKGHANARFAFVEYRDYFEEFIYRVTQFTDDFNMLQRALDRYRPTAGGDVPEAVDEALYGALGELKWKSKTRLIILVGDAPPHPLPQGRITHGMVTALAAERRVAIVPIVLPTDSTKVETIRK